jgi:excisionase family DNA binding protein
MATRLTYTVPEVAELLGISRSTAYECVRRGEIPSLTLGRRVVISRMAFEAFPATHTPASTSGADLTPQR